MISVVIPTYNRAHLIKKCVESVLAQTYKDIEVIVVDDGSTDNTKEMVLSICDDRIRYIYQKNQGACVARNRGVSTAKGDYIAFQDSDDEWSSNKLEKQCKVLDEHQEVDIVCCKTICKKLDGTEFVSLKNRNEGIISNDVGPYGISTQTLLVRRKVFEDTLFDPNVTRYQDLDFLLCAIKNYKIYCVAECLVLRHHEDDSISTHSDRVYKMAEYFQKKHNNIIEDKTQFLSYFLASVLIEESRTLPYIEKKKYISKAFELNHSIKIFAKAMLSMIYRK